MFQRRHFGRDDHGDFGRDINRGGNRDFCRGRCRDINRGGSRDFCRGQCRDINRGGNRDLCRGIAVDPDKHTGQGRGPKWLGLIRQEQARAAPTVASRSANSLARCDDRPSPRVPKRPKVQSYAAENQRLLYVAAWQADRDY